MLRKLERQADPLRCPCCSMGMTHSSREHERHVERWCEEHQRWCGDHRVINWEERLQQLRTEWGKLNRQAA
jgi:hypothetical protein